MARTGSTQDEPQPVSQHLASPWQSASVWHSLAQEPLPAASAGHCPGLCSENDQLFISFPDAHFESEFLTFPADAPEVDFVRIFAV